MGDDELTLQFFHGALVDEDVDKVLENDGDYLLQSRYEKGHSRIRLVIAIKTKEGVARVDIKRNEKGARVTQINKTFTTIKSLVEYVVQKGIEVNGQTIQLKKAIPKGKFQLQHTDIRLLKKIGSGAYGTVYKGLLLKDSSKKTYVAVKRIDSETTDEQGLIDMMKEARVMQLYDHPNIVRFYGYIVDRVPYLLVMEFCTDGSVEDKLRDFAHQVSAPQRVDMCYQGATGLEYLHAKNCIHRDIATRNCLLSGNTLKLADFGMCRATAIYKVDLTKPQNVRWLAPEVWKTGETKPCTDVYAYGVMLWEMFEIPYASPYSTWKAATVKQKVMGGYRMKAPPAMPDEMKEVLALAWHHKPEKRPTATELKKMLAAVCKIHCPESVDEGEENADDDGSGKNMKSAQKAMSTTMTAIPNTPRSAPSKGGKKR